jgi:putative ABC transport system permease protein
MFKSAILSIKKSIGKSLLLLILMCVIANLVIAGLSIKEATTKSMNQVRTSLGSDVTLSYNMKGMMKDREKGATMDSVMQNITLEMADSLKELDYVDHYNYTLSVDVSSDDIDPIQMSEDTTNNTNNDNKMMQDNGSKLFEESDFSISGNTTMAYLSSFTDSNYTLSEGRLLEESDDDSKNCVIESTLASDNDLKVGSTFKVYTTNDDETTSVTLTVVGIYEIETSNDMNTMMDNRQNPMNTIYTDLTTAQTLNNSDTIITSATYYLDDPANIDAFEELAKSKTDIDFETYTLDANDEVYQRSVTSLENISSFVNMFLWVVVIAGSVILCLILVLTMRSRFYEFGVMLSLGQSKIKIIGQQIVEIGIIAVIAFCLSLCSGKVVSNVVSSFLVSNETSSNQVMEMNKDDEKKTDNDEITGNKGNGKMSFGERMAAPTSTELDVSLTSNTIIDLAGITFVICAVSVVLPSLYVLRLSPREILIKKEG